MRQDQMRCPNCGGIAESDSVDVGVGLMVRGNFACECGWGIDGPEDYGFVTEAKLDAAFPPQGDYPICPKCSSPHGNDWSQCGGSCPMTMSPHYDPNWSAAV